MATVNDEAPPGDRIIAITDVTVLPMEGPERLLNRSVIIRNGTIEEIGAAGAVAVPDGARTIDGAGRYLMPGLSDMHTHLFWSAGKMAQTAHWPEDPFNCEVRLELLAYLATGVTLVRDMSGSHRHLLYRGAVASGEVPGPRIVACSPIIEGARAVWPFSTKVLEPEEAGPVVAGFAAAGYDYVKVYHTVTAPVYDAVLASAAAHGLKVVGHVPFDIGVERALASGQYGIEHLRGYDFDRLDREILEKDGGRSPERMGSWLGMSDARMAELARATASAGTWNVPTIAVAEHLSIPEKRAAILNDPCYPLLSPGAQASVAPGSMDAIFPPETKLAVRKAIPRQLDFVKALHDAGANLMIGTDCPSPALVKGFTPIDEIAAFVAAGIPLADVLRIATAEAARSLGEEATTGTVSVGKRTDLILLDADPLADATNLWSLHGVVANGRWHTRAMLLDWIASLRETLNAE